MKNLKSLGTLVFTGLVLFTTKVSAQDILPKSRYGLPDLTFGDGLTGFISFIIYALLFLAGTISVLFIIIGGFQYILSGASEDLAKKGRTTVTNAIIGLVIVILSYTVIRVVTRTFLAN